jgi:hypothetical protein
MRIRLKTLCMGALTILVVAAAAIGHAAAETGGHLLSEVAHTEIKGSEGKETGHQLSFIAHGLEGEIVCDEASYQGTVSNTTVTEVSVTPAYAKCHTKGSEAGTTTVTANGCEYRFTVAPGNPETVEQTVDLVCPSGKAIEIHHPNCTFKIIPQNNLSGFTYTPTVESGKPAITLDVSTQFNTQFEGGICIFIGTNHTGTLKGAGTAKGLNTTGEAVGIRVNAREFRSETTHPSFTGSQTTNSKYTFGELLGSVECTGSTFDGTSSTEKSTQLTLKPTYTGCEGVKGRQITTHTNGCAYILTAGWNGTSGTVDIECPAGAAIETTVDKFPEGCTITIGAQSTGGTVDYKAEGSGSGRDLLLAWTLSGIDYTRDGCEIGGTGNNGTLSGTVTLQGEDTSGNAKGLWIE